MTETPYFLEYRSSKSPNVLPALGGERSFGGIRALDGGCGRQEMWVKLKTETMMRMKWMLITLTLLGMAALTFPANGQDSAPESGQTGTAAARRVAAGSRSQTDIGVSGFYTLTSSSTGADIHQTPTNAPGGMFELRHIANPLVGYELAFSFNPADQAYAPVAGSCGLTCQTPPTKISGNAAEVAIDYIVSKKFGNLRPFAVGGLGVFIAIPGPTPLGNNTALRGTYIFGGGVDYDLGSHLGVRAQFRDNLYKAPNTSSIYPATGAFTQSMEPMGGVYYRF
jgi:hypothetical protein